MLTPLKEILLDACRHGYAVGAFNCLSIENVTGAIQAAEELRSPIILQLAEIQFPYAPLEMMAPVFLDAAKNASIPVAVHLDHGLSYETCARAIRLGFGSVMFDGSGYPLEENIRLTRAVARMAHAFGTDVEAELGKVGNAEEAVDAAAGSEAADVCTDAGEAVHYVEQTGADALAIAIGNMHGRYVATPQLNIARLKDIRARLDTPLVLHGGSGTSEADFKACIHHGIGKINVATALQVEITEEIGRYFAESDRPNYIEMKRRMATATKRAVSKHILLFESNNRI